MNFEDFISRFERKQKNSKGFMLACPAHDDNPKTPSLSASRGDDGRILLKCFAGCTNESIVGSLGLKMSDLFSDKAAVTFSPPRRELAVEESDIILEKIYSYRDENGGELYQALRYKPKTFRQRHFKNGKWIWKMDGIERVLYRLPEILKAEQVVIVEGEKDAENLSAIGFESTCNVGGAGKWLDSYSENLTGKEIIICGDNDEAGKKHVELVAKSLKGKVKSLRILKLPESVKDASDFIALFKDPREAASAVQDLISISHPIVNGKPLPLYSISESEDHYRRFVRSMNENSFSLGRWLPTLGKVRALVPGEFVVIIGDTGTGKTGVLQQITNAALPLPTVLFELELPREIMFERYAGMISKFTGEQVEAAYRSSDDSLKDLLQEKLGKLIICTESKLTVPQIEDLVNRAELKLGERPRVVVIDYLQILKAVGQNRRERLSDIAEELKVMAKSTRTIVIAASQIARPQNADENWEPSLHSAKESGSIEQSCGILLSVWKDPKDSTALNVRVLKSTKGGTGTFVKCNFDGARMIINERTSPQQSPYSD